ncbi:hypothetical protein ACE1CD_05810 [Aerosakkonema sp. BLCC-F183]|uniref:hypothetical protein n=1 Tax=Aerosakkonema sp. BLCC-F183 TaxID=3342834 RepID=UPI0035B873DE
MGTPQEVYVNGIKKQLNNYYAAWLPSTKFQLGDVGFLTGNLFNKVTSLENLGISFKESPDHDSTKIEYVSESGVSRVIKVAGQLNPNLPNIPQGQAGIGIEFSKEGAFIIQAEESFEPFIDDLVKLEKDIRQAYQDGNWKSGWVVITQLIRSPNATIMISNSSQSKIELSAEGDVTLQGISLGNARAKFAVRAETGQIFKLIDAQNITPFFKLLQIAARPWPVFNALNFRSSSPRIGSLNAIDFITPKLAKDNLEIANSLYLDVAQKRWDSEDIE